MYMLKAECSSRLYAQNPYFEKFYPYEKLQKQPKNEDPIAEKLELC